jgi:hypothetical protein
VTIPPDPQQPGGYAYNPYAVPARPAEPGPPSEPPAGRPVIVIVAVLLLILGAVPLLLVGVPLVVGNAARAAVTPEVLEGTGLTVDQVVAFLRAVGAVALVLALLHIGFAIVAFMGRRWGRIAVTITAVLVALFVIVPLPLVIAAGAMAAAIVGAVLLYVGGSQAYFANPRR